VPRPMAGTASLVFGTTRVITGPSSAVGRVVGVCWAASALGEAKAALDTTARPRDPLKKSLREDVPWGAVDRSLIGSKYATQNRV
jgi:hypothetical protein